MLHRQRTSLKLILSADPENNKDFFLLFKLSMVYFMLTKYEAASGFISRAVQFCPKTFPLQKVQLWKGLIYYYYLYSNRRGGFVKDKTKAE